MAVSFECAWPARELWHNDRSHWSGKARATREARKEAFYAAKEAGSDDIKGMSSYDVSVIFEPPDKRKRDRHNMPDTVKPHLDGLQDALGVDDNTFNVEWEYGPSGKPGAVVFVVEGVE